MAAAVNPAANPAFNNQQFRTLLTGNRIGSSEETADAIMVTQGIQNIGTLVNFIMKEQVKGIAKLVRYGYQASPVLPPPAEGAPLPPVLPDAPHVNAVAATKLHVVWYWGSLRLQCRRTLSATANVLTNAEIRRTLEHI